MRFVIHLPVSPANLRLPPVEERRALRTDCSATLADLAWAMRVDTATVSRWERGEVEPRGAGRLVYAALLAQLRERRPRKTNTPPGGADGAFKSHDSDVHGGAYRGSR